MKSPSEPAPEAFPRKLYRWLDLNKYVHSKRALLMTSVFDTEANVVLISKIHSSGCIFPFPYIDGESWEVSE